jgi:hypothetical protein
MNHVVRTPNLVYYASTRHVYVTDGDVEIRIGTMEPGIGQSPISTGPLRAEWFEIYWALVMAKIENRRRRK